MGNFNKVLLLGNLTRDVELKYTPSNTAVANIGLAINRQWKNRDGEAAEETVFVDCEAWGRQAEVMNEYLAKGRPVFIEGRLKLDQWEDQQGNPRKKMKVVVENFQFVDSRGGGSARGEGEATQPAAAPGEPHRAITEGDIPF